MKLGKYKYPKKVGYLGWIDSTGEITFIDLKGKSEVYVWDPTTKRYREKISRKKLPDNPSKRWEYEEIQISENY